MTQRDLNRAVARATGESVSDIDRLGFSELPDPASDADDRVQPAILDWDELEAVLASDDPDSHPCPLFLVA